MALPTRISLSANADEVVDVTLELLGQFAVVNMNQAQNVTRRGMQMARNAANIFPFRALVFPFRELPCDATS
ncbi:MAG: hypothetical protein WAL97_07345 [Halobacteriota archaeon]